MTPAGQGSAQVDPRAQAAHDAMAAKQGPQPPDLGEGIVALQDDPTALPESEPPAPSPDAADSAKLEVWHAVEALAIAAKAFSTGDPLFIDAQKARDFAHGSFYLMQGLSMVDPPAPQDGQVAQQRVELDAAKAASQEQQATERNQTTIAVAGMAKDRQQGSGSNQGVGGGRPSKPPQRP